MLDFSLIRLYNWLLNFRIQHAFWTVRKTLLRWNRSEPAPQTIVTVFTFVTLVTLVTLGRVIAALWRRPACYTCYLCYSCYPSPGPSLVRFWGGQACLVGRIFGEGERWANEKFSPITPLVVAGRR